MNLVRLSCHVGLGLPALLLSCTGPEAISQTGAVASTIEHDRGVGLTGVPSAVAKAAGVTAANVLSPELIAVVAAQGANPVENIDALASVELVIKEGRVVFESR